MFSRILMIFLLTSVAVTAAPTSQEKKPTRQKTEQRVLKKDEVKVGLSPWGQILIKVNQTLKSQMMTITFSLLLVIHVLVPFLQLYWSRRYGWYQREALELGEQD